MTTVLLAAVFTAQAFTPGFAASKTAGATTAQNGAKTPSASASDPGWPRELTREGVRIVYYQPQIDDWSNFSDLQARAAFALTPKNGKTAVGVEEIRGHTVADLQKRTVLIDDIQIVAVRFPSLPSAEADAMEALLRKTFPGKQPLTVSLDRLIASVQASQEKVKPVPVKTDPPPIFVSTEPAILLTVPEKPVLAPIQGLPLKFVLNANWDLFFEPGDSRYYLLVDKLWLTAEALDGAWSTARSLPSDFKKLPDGQGWDHVKKAAANPAGNAKAPKLFYSAQPAELIVFAGEPAYKPIAGTQLSYATNTQSWVFTDADDGQIYFLVTGRWFRAPKLDGPWSYAGNDLPEDFKRIPADSEPAEVLASVPGTPESEDAILLAQVPTSATVNTAEAEAKVKVNYYGEPRFTSIEGTPLSYAANANADVIRFEGKYYLCENAIWFVSSSPTGPWKVATTVPDAIYAIPPSSPVYHVTYVKVQGSSQGQVVCSYTSGYYGAYVAGMATGAALVWGTGYYYPPYVYTGAVPVYRPYYATYGVSAAYYPNSGVYGIGGYAYGPYAGYGQAAWYNPNTGAYGRAYTQQYPYGGRTSAWGYNPSTNTSWTTQQGHGYYAQWGSSTVTRGDQTVQTAHVATNYGSSGVVKGQNNLYAGHDGNVYQRDANGNWSKWDNGQWQPVNPPSGSNSRNGGQSGGNVGATNPTQGEAKPRGSPTQRTGKTGRQTSSGSTLGATSPAATPRGRGETPTGKPTPASASESKRRSGEGQQSSNDVLNQLNREASARHRGSQRVNMQQRSQGRTARAGGERETRNVHGRGGRFRE
ncbi:MAG: hypothetical protein JO069_17850 [Verrucomicrobia bacterium]|nr:hypothetical protein [Verrucomicrobiota bacterium]